MFGFGLSQIRFNLDFRTKHFFSFSFVHWCRHWLWTLKSFVYLQIVECRSQSNLFKFISIVSLKISPISMPFSSLNDFVLKVKSLFFFFVFEIFSFSVKNDQSIYLLAQTYYQTGDVNKSYWLLRNSSIEHLPAAKFLLAKCCFDTEKFVRFKFEIRIEKKRLRLDFTKQNRSFWDDRHRSIRSFSTN